MKFDFKTRGLNISIELDHRICMLYGDSGIGKSLIFSILQDGYFQEYGYKYFYINFSNYQMVEYVKTNNDPKCIVVLDNLDLYFDSCSELLDPNNECIKVAIGHSLPAMPTGCSKALYDLQRDGINVHIGRKVFK